MANFAILAPDGETIVTTGDIPREDFEIQTLTAGHQFKALAEADSGISHLTHKFDVSTNAFVQVRTRAEASQAAVAAAKARFADRVRQVMAPT